ncbi:MAG: galactokinase, partial [Clostridia bacterium]|nr:galactokinase [Clostridia bacterium]
MHTVLLKEKLQSGALEKYGHLYRDVKQQSARYLRAIEAFEAKFGEREELFLFSVPGRSELSGNHTDHNFGKVLAGAIDRDIIAVVAKSADGAVQLKSEGFPMDCVCLADVPDKNNFKKFTSSALIAGMLSAFAQRGLATGGFDAYTETEVLKGSGLSSSAAFEVMVGNI